MISVSDTSGAGHGYFLDGKSPRKQFFSLAVTEEGMRYRLLPDGAVGEWPFAIVTWAQSPLDRKPLCLRKLDDEDAALVVTDPLMIQKILVMQKLWRRRNFRLVYAEQRNMLFIFFLIFCFFISIWLTWPIVADRIAASAPVPLRNAINSLGDHYLEKEKICSTPESQQALRVIQDRLAVGRPQLQRLKLIVVDKPAVNAYTLPGYQVVFTSGLLEHAASGDEVAGVMAHEFGHVLNDHIVRGFLRNIVTKMFVAMMSQAVGSFSTIADTFIGNAYSRGFESAADATGLMLLREARISPKGLEDFFQRLASDEKNPSLQLTYLLDHPAPTERLAMIRAAEAAMPPGASPALDAQQWQALQTSCHPPAH